MTAERSTFAERAKEAEERGDRPKKVGPSLPAGINAEGQEVTIIHSGPPSDKVRRISVDGQGNVTTTGKEDR